WDACSGATAPDRPGGAGQSRLLPRPARPLRDLGRGGALRLVLAPGPRARRQPGVAALLRHGALGLYRERLVLGVRLRLGRHPVSLWPLDYGAGLRLALGAGLHLGPGLGFL